MALFFFFFFGGGGGGERGWGERIIPESQADSVQRENLLMRGRPHFPTNLSTTLYDQ